MIDKGAETNALDGAGQLKRPLVCDLHPDYAGTQLAKKGPQKAIPIQHHHAHVVSCMSEHGLSGPVLGIAWDGTGLGTDGTLWGGEFLLTHRGRFERLGHLRTFGLPGGAQAIREPRRSALGLLYEIMKENTFHLTGLPCLENFTEAELQLLQQVLRKKINCPRTSSMGRFFDAIASLTGICHRSSFEGEGATYLESAAEEDQLATPYPFPILRQDSSLILDWEPMVQKILQDLKDQVPTSLIAKSFHLGLAQMIVQFANRVGEEKVVLTGGCFQNKILCEAAITELKQAGFQPYWHQKVPPNDGGIALGQLVAALNQEGGLA